MTVGTLLLLINILGGMGSLAKNIIDIRTELQKQPLTALAPTVHVEAVKAALGPNGSVWDETHTGN